MKPVRSLLLLLEEENPGEKYRVGRDCLGLVGVGRENWSVLVGRIERGPNLAEEYEGEIWVVHALRAFKGN